MADITDHLNRYEMNVPDLYRIPDMNELDIAMKSINRGINFDGLPPNILRIIPEALKDIILALLQKIFFGLFLIFVSD